MERKVETPRPGDLIKYRKEHSSHLFGREKVFLVTWVDLKNDWVQVHGMKSVIQICLMEVISRGKSSDK